MMSELSLDVVENGGCTELVKADLQPPGSSRS